MLIVIAAMASYSGGIGYQNTLPWKQAADMAFFKRTTSGSAVIMGRKTFESLGKALPNRLNIIITRDLSDKSDTTNVKYVTSIEAAVDLGRAYSEDTYAIGGAEIYDLALPMADKFYATMVHVFSTYRNKVDFDAFFPAEPLRNWKIDSVMERGVADEKNQFSYDILSLSPIPTEKGHDYYRGGAVFMSKRLAGAYKAIATGKKDVNMHLPRIKAVTIPFEKLSFHFPENARTFSPYYFKKYLPHKTTIALPLTDHFEMVIDIASSDLREKLKVRFFNCLRDALLLNGCTIV